MKYSKLILTMAVAASIGVLALASPEPVPTTESAGTAIVKSSVNISYPTTVVELFTSQGCSSCPPANELVRGLIGSEDLLALSYSVDYWDYLGWKDTHGKPEFSARQRQYGQQFQGQVYTPQIVVNGSRHKSRFTEPEIRTQKIQNAQPVLSMSLAQDGLEFTGSGGGGTVMEVRYTQGLQSVPVSRGENRGRTIALANVVTSCKSLGEWKQGEKFSQTLEAPAPGQAVAVIVQDSVGGPITGVANYAP